MSGSWSPVLAYLPAGSAYLPAGSPVLASVNILLASLQIGMQQAQSAMSFACNPYCYIYTDPNPILREKNASCSSGPVEIKRMFSAGAETLLNKSKKTMICPQRPVTAISYKTVCEPEANFYSHQNNYHPPPFLYVCTISWCSDTCTPRWGPRPWVRRCMLRLDRLLSSDT